MSDFNEITVNVVVRGPAQDGSYKLKVKGKKIAVMSTLTAGDDHTDPSDPTLITWRIRNSPGWFFYADLDRALEFEIASSDFRNKQMSSNRKQISIEDHNSHGADIQSFKYTLRVRNGSASAISDPVVVNLGPDF